MSMLYDFFSKISTSVLLITTIPSIITLYVSFKNSLGLEKNQRKVEIMNKSLTLFYTPMQIKYGNIKAKQLNKKEVSEFYAYISENSEVNYLYVNPLIHKNLIVLKAKLETDKDYRFIVNNIIDHLNKETYRLRKVLGYPYLNFFNALTFMDPLYILTFILYILLILSCISTYLITAIKGKVSDYLFNEITSYAIIILLVFLLYLIFYVIYISYKLFINLRNLFLHFYKRKKKYFQKKITITTLESKIKDPPSSGA